MLQFRRITTQKRFIPQIDGLRFVAIASVVLFHVYDALEGRAAVRPPVLIDSDLPKRGVELFFVISGFILGVPFASHHLRNAAPVGLKQYFLRRVTRLEPPYFLSFPVWAFMQWVSAHRGFSDMAPHLLPSCFYMHNLVFGAFARPVNAVAWSLEIEIQFYILVPVLSLLFLIGNDWVRRGVILGVMASAGILTNPLYVIGRIRYSIIYYLAFFLAGFLLCDFYLKRGEWKRSFLWDILAIGLWPLVWYPGARNAAHLLLPFVIVVLYLAAFRGRICSAFFSHPLITDIGGMCYSIYLFHFPVIYGVKRITAYWHIGHNFWAFFALQCLIILPAVALFCGAFFLMIERPCMDREWPRKVWQRFRATMLFARPSPAP